MSTIYVDFVSLTGLVFDGREMVRKTEKDPHAVHLGQLGGKARTQKLTADRRREIARRAAQIRWAKTKKKES
jgi:hypothetical protein